MNNDKNPDRAIIRHAGHIAEQLAQALGIDTEADVKAHPDRSVQLLVTSGDDCYTSCVGTVTTLAASLAAHLYDQPQLIEPLAYAIARIRPDILEDVITSHIANRAPHHDNPADNLPS